MLITTIINNKEICIKGVGKLFYESGFPISITVSELKKKNIEVSILHVADECLKNGWSAKTTFNKLKTDFEEDIEKNEYDLQLLEKFCNSTYEEQRELIFQSLFETTTNNVRNKINIEPLKWLKENLI